MDGMTDAEIVTLYVGCTTDLTKVGLVLTQGYGDRAEWEFVVRRRGPKGEVVWRGTSAVKLGAWTSGVMLGFSLGGFLAHTGEECDA